MKTLDILFVCETNAATSLMAEAIVNHAGDPGLRAFSAGRNPLNARLDVAMDLLKSRAIAVDGLAPKPLSIFTMAGARQPDLIVDLATVTWNNRDLSGLASVLRWPLRDPALSFDKRERRPIAEAVMRELMLRINRELGRHLRAVAVS